MLFNEFAHRSAIVIKGKSTTSAFARTLFEAMLSSKNRKLLDNTSDNTFKSYYSGHTSINQIAKIIYADINTKLFSEFLIQHGKNAVQKLCEVFSDSLTDISPDNAGEKIAELFYQIIREAAQNDMNMPPSNQQSTPNYGVVYNQQGNTINNYKIDYVNTINC